MVVPSLAAGAGAGASSMGSRLVGGGGVARPDDGDEAAGGATNGPGCPVGVGVLNWLGGAVM